MKYYRLCFIICRKIIHMGEEHITAGGRPYRFVMTKNYMVLDQV